MRNKPTRILFLQHARGLGGSTTSLRYTVEALDSTGFEPMVGLIFPRPEVRAYYENAGIGVLDFTGTPLLHHTTARIAKISKPLSLLEFAENLYLRKNLKEICDRAFKHYQIDLIHLNSVVLAPVAEYLLKHDLPFVWHIRESPVKGYFGVRFRYMQRLLRQAGNRVIFLSDADKREWVNGTNGTVIYNFINFERFDDKKACDTLRVLKKETNGVARILYLGGFTEIKGIFPLLEALAKLKEEQVPFVCLMPKTAANFARSVPAWKKAAKATLSWLGRKSVHENCDFRIRELGLEARVLRLPFFDNIGPLMRLCDCLVFPSIEPHFARPVIEAQAMGVPVVGSRVDGVTELVERAGCGVLVTHGRGRELARGIEDALQLKQSCPAALNAAREFARSEYASNTQIQKIEAIYRDILAL